MIGHAALKTQEPVFKASGNTAEGNQPAFAKQQGTKQAGSQVALGDWKVADMGKGSRPDLFRRRDEERHRRRDHLLRRFLLEEENLEDAVVEATLVAERPISFIDTVSEGNS